MLGVILMTVQQMVCWRVQFFLCLYSKVQQDLHKEIPPQQQWWWCRDSQSTVSKVHSMACNSLGWFLVVFGSHNTFMVQLQVASLFCMCCHWWCYNIVQTPVFGSPCPSPPLLTISLSLLLLKSPLLFFMVVVWKSRQPSASSPQVLFPPSCCCK